MSALKKKQVSVFSGVLTIPAQLQSDESKKRLFEESGAEGEEPVINKRTKVQHNNDPRHMRNFEESMRSYLTSRILDVLKKGKATTLEKNIVKLKEGLSSATRLPIGIMGKAAELSGLEPSVMKNYMDNNAEKLTLNLWKQYVEENFDKIAQSVKGRNLSFPTASTSSSSAKKTEEIYRTFSVSLKKVLRDDMDGQVNDVVRRKLQLAMEECSILRAQYLLVLQIFIMLLKRNSLVEIDGRIDSVPTVGFDLRKLLPQYFVELGDLNNPITTCCPLLPPNASEMFTKDANLLFTEQHLQLIFSHFFGLKGSTQKSLDAHPVQSALFDLLPKDSFEGVFELSKVQSEQKSILSTSILTNISNMWGDNKIFSKLLDKLLIVLLRLHLAPVRAALNYKKWKSREPNNSSTSSSSSTTPLIQSQQKRNIVRAEHKKLRKRLEKLESCHDVDKEAALMKGITNNELRIAYFKNLPSKKKIQPLVPEQIRKDNDDEDDQQEIDDVTDDNDQQETNDLSSGRIRSLKSLAKHMLLSFSDEEISQERIQDELIDGTQKEIEVLMSIVKSLKAYIPKRDDRFIIAQQLPFCILANDVLRATGYSFFTLKLFPEPKFSSSVSLELSATSLYQLLTSGPNPLVIADFNNSKIDSIDYARSNKDASFCSIFNLITLNQVGASYKLKFAHRISILPGLKTVRILGTKEVPLAQPDTGNNASYLSKIMSNPNIVEEAKKKKEDLQSEIFTCNDDLKKHQRELKDLLKKDAIRELSKRIKDLKKKRLGESDKRVKDELTTAIATLKSTRYNEHTQIQCRRQQVSVVKQYIYFKQMAIRYHKQLSSKESVAAVQKRKLEVASENHGLFKAEECRIEKDSKCTFSGTDNGVVNLSATVPFDQSRFSFHLDLYNKYEILKEDGADITLHEDEKKYLDLAHPVLIKPDDIDVGCGFRKARKKLERRKRNSEDGKQVLAAEKILAENSLKNASTIPNLLDAVKLHQQPSQIIRSFYDSAKQARSSRAVEIQKKRFLQILVTKERKSLKEKGAQSIMFVGDRGTGVGSRIKGYRRYGGKWLMEMRGKRGVVCITNEHNTSQTCLFCYQKLDHPRRILKEGNTEKEKKVSGVLLCVNPKCISVITGHATKARDALSAMAIGISGASNCFLGETLHCFSPYKISQSATESLKTNTASFLRGKADLSKA